MKLTDLIWVLALAGVAVAGCNSGPAITGCDPGDIVNSDGLCESEDGTGGTGGTAGTGGTGGIGGSDGGECTNDADQAVYDALVYTDDDGIDHSGSSAAAAMASDCVFGSGNATPTSDGCGNLAAQIINCAIAGSCTPELVAELADCVVTCAQGLIEEVTGSQLSTECSGCYGDSVSCSAELCATSGCSNPTSSSCIQCRCEEGCTPGFDVCSGLAPSGDCD